MGKERLLVRKQTIMHLIDPVDFREPEIAAEQVGHRTALIPLPMETPLAARSDEPIGAQRLEDQIPARALAAGRQPLRPKAIQSELRVKPAGQPARAPLPGPVQRQRLEPEAHDALVARGRDAILGEERHGARPRRIVLENLDRLAPRLALAVIDFTQVEHMALDDFSAGHALVFDDAPIVMRLAILEAFAAAQEHDGSG